MNLKSNRNEGLHYPSIKMKEWESKLGRGEQVSLGEIATRDTRQTKKLC